jgi:methyl-accepting chemotaxis protein
LLIVTLGSMTALMVTRERALLRRELSERARSTASLVGKLCVDPLLYDDVLKIDAIATEVLAQPEVEYAMVRAADGRWVTTLLAGTSEMARRRLDIPDHAVATDVMPILLEADGIERVKVDITQSDMVLGSIALGLSRARSDASARALVRQMAGAIAVVLALLATMLWGLSRMLITRPLGEAVALAGRLAEGDLGATVTAASEDESGRLLRAMATLVANLRETMGRIRAASRDVSGASAQVAASAGQTVASAESQAATARQTADAAQELETTVGRLSATASEISRSIGRMGTTGEALRAKLADTATEIAAMQEDMRNLAAAIVTQAEKAQQVQQVMRSVADLAERTKIVSLNASIEAARSTAGGQGFAIVAKEMRLLSDESRQLARSTGVIAGEVAAGAIEAARSAIGGQDRFREGLRRIDEVLGEVERFARSVDSSQGEVAVVLAGVTEQSTGIRQIAEGAQSTDRNVQQMLEQTQQLEVAAKALGEVSRVLEDSVRTYRFD